MRSRSKALGMRQVAEIRDLRRAKAEADAYRARLESLQTEDDLSQGISRRDDRFEGWRAALSDGRFHLASVWSSAALESEDALNALRAKAGQAGDAESLSRGVWRTALAVADAAKDRRDLLVKRHRLEQQEAALNETAERILQRRGR